ncbi:acetyltransferase, GNAT family [Desulfosporosinus sp. I2]|uniref:GNAT family N-acetyltransferase n=1 Tax=Desulfosporosinus sp. I2 TaxID=1617025 RepID=UPI00061EC41A|nr:GNAT family N-acetyltransferase [Desulfosporosinus sp. I2]KJR46273.1 acetyltransferase, GNAT family [Desulfosporosinus sp. I2]
MFGLLHDGVLPSKREALEIFNSLPPGKNYEDKFTLGIYKYTNELVGIIDLVKDFSVKGEWMLGLLLIEPKESGNGLGKLIHEALIQWATTLESKSFRVGVIEDNFRGKKFWSDLGYKEIKEVTVVKPEMTHLVNV